MRILFLAPANSVHSARWIRWFAAAGHAVTWISTHPAEIEIPPSISLHVLPHGNALTRWPRWLMTVRRIVRLASPDVVQVHSLGTYALLAGGVPTGVPVVSTPWGSDIILDANRWWRRAIVRRTLARSAFCTCDALHMRPRLEALGVPQHRMRLINFGIEADRFTPIATARFARAAFDDPQTGDVATRPLRVLSLRNLDSVYDISTLIQAASKLKQAKVPVAVDIFGGGALREQLEEEARALGVADIVRFRGRYSHETLPSILAEADVYVSTSTSDAGIAASTAEAMAAGLPAIISDSGENSAWITDRVNGRLFPVGDPSALAQSLTEAFQSPAKAREWALAGQSTILERNDYQTEMRKAQALYAEAARGARDS